MSNHNNNSNNSEEEEVDIESLVNARLERMFLLFRFIIIIIRNMEINNEIYDEMNTRAR